MKTSIIQSLLGMFMLASANTLKAQVVASDSVMQHAKGNRLSIGGYGEAALSRMFYSDHVFDSVEVTPSRK